MVWLLVTDPDVAGMPEAFASQATVTVCVSGALQTPRVKVAETVQSLVIAPVVYAVPESVPAGQVPATDVE